jgi:hypothetical protein
MYTEISIDSRAEDCKGSFWAGGWGREERGEGCLEFLGGMQISLIDADGSHP